MNHASVLIDYHFNFYHFDLVDYDFGLISGRTTGHIDGLICVNKIESFETDVARGKTSQGEHSCIG